MQSRRMLQRSQLRLVNRHSHSAAHFLQRREEVGRVALVTFGAHHDPAVQRNRAQQRLTAHFLRPVGVVLVVRVLQLRNNARVTFTDILHVESRPLVSLRPVLKKTRAPLVLRRSPLQRVEQENYRSLGNWPLKHTN